MELAISTVIVQISLKKEVGTKRMQSKVSYMEVDTSTLIKDLDFIRIKKHRLK